jgi:hypothetical protein
MKKEERKNITPLLEEGINDDLAYKLTLETTSENDVCKHCGSSTGLPFIRLVGFHRILEEMRHGDYNQHDYVGLMLQRKNDSVIVTNRKTKQEKVLPLVKKQEKLLEDA